MNQRVDAIDIRILRATNDIIGAVGDLRSIIATPTIEERDRAYLEREIDRVQEAVHRIAAFAEHLTATKH